MSNDNLTKAMNIVLADSYALYLKYHNYHWNVEGERFYGLHNFIEVQYTEMAVAVDDVAEMIRQLGAKAPGSFKKFMEYTNIKDGNEEASASEMVTDLAKDQDVIMASVNSALKLAQELEDEAAIGLLVDRLSVHKKTKWMLVSMSK